MAGELAYDPATGQLLYSPATGQLALGCASGTPCGIADGVEILISWSETITCYSGTCSPFATSVSMTIEGCGDSVSASGFCALDPFGTPILPWAFSATIAWDTGTSKWVVDIQMDCSGDASRFLGTADSLDGAYTPSISDGIASITVAVV